MKVLPQRVVAQNLRMAFAQVFARRDQKSRRAAGGIADHIAGPRLGQLNHELDDVTWGAELTVLPGTGDLPQHVFVEIALGVAVFHRHLSHEIDHLGQQRGRGDREARILHVPRVGRLVSA